VPGSRPSASWNAGPCWRPITTCGLSTPPECSGSTRCCPRQGAPALGEGTLRTGPGLAALQDVSAAHLSPVGHLQVATALQVPGALEARLHVVRYQLLDAARHLAGARVQAARLYGVGPVTALAITCWLGGAGRFSSSRQAVRFAGPGRDPLVLGPQGPARAPAPAGAACAALGGLRGRKDPRPEVPDHAYYATVKDRCGGKRAALWQARKILRQACHILAEPGGGALAAA
jgi:hypothetical protein